MSSFKGYALHGFLGTPADWDFLHKSRRLFEGDAEAVDLFSWPIDSHSEWAQHFNRYVREHSLGSKKCLIGYSLGGRLALHCLLQDPSLWDAAILISTHCGLVSEGQKRERRQVDESWAKRFQTLEWEPLMKAWNAQEVFRNARTVCTRREEEFSRERLSAALRCLSLANQEPLWELVGKLPLPILWITGKEDLKFTELAKKVHLKDPLSKMCAIVSAGHRVPWENPEQFIEEVEAFLRVIEKERGA